MNTKPFDLARAQAGDPVVVAETFLEVRYIGMDGGTPVFATGSGYQAYWNDGNKIGGFGDDRLVMAPKTKRVTVWTRHYLLIESGGVSCAVHTDPDCRILEDSRFRNNKRTQWIAPAFPTTYEIEE